MDELLELGVEGARGAGFLAAVEEEVDQGGEGKEFEHRGEITVRDRQKLGLHCQTPLSVNVRCRVTQELILRLSNRILKIVVEGHIDSSILD